VRTACEPVRKFVPKLWDGDKGVFCLCIDPEKLNSKIFKVDAVLHIGMLDKPGEMYRLERNASKHEYSLPDVEGGIRVKTTRLAAERGSMFSRSCQRTSISTRYFNKLAQN
jgi:hypothetical protein